MAISSSRIAYIRRSRGTEPEMCRSIRDPEESEPSVTTLRGNLTIPQPWDQLEKELLSGQSRSLCFILQDWY